MKFILFILLSGLFICCYFLLKNKVTIKNHFIIINAIGRYLDYCIDNDIEPLVYFYDMEFYDKTLYRWCDWGYIRILPYDKYEVIEPFIDERSVTYAAQ